MDEEKRLRLTVRREGSLLSKVFEADINERQLEAALLVVLNPHLADEAIAAAVLDAEISARLGDRRLTQPLQGIAQYQAESR